MKICILVAGLPPVYNGGTEVATLKIAKYAALAGHNVHIIALDGTDRGEIYYLYNQECIASNEQLYKFNVYRIATLPISYFYGLVALPSVVFKVLKIKPDVIHSQGFQMGISAIVASFITKIPYIVYGRGEIYVDWFMKSFISKLLMKHAKRVIAQTEHMKTEMLKYYKRDIEVIPNGIDVEQFGQIGKREARVKLGLPLDKKIVIWVGNDRPEKNLQRFDDAMRWLVHYRLDVLAVIVTNQSYRDVILNMCAADVLVNTSNSEGFPMTILEAMASGLPVVAPDICGIKEIVGREAILTDNSVSEIIQAVESILDTREMADNMSFYGKQRAKQFTWGNVVKKLYRKQ